MKEDRRVLVSGPQGQVEATLLGERGGHYQCRLSDGRTVWVPAENVSRADGGALVTPPIIDAPITPGHGAGSLPAGSLPAGSLPAGPLLQGPPIANRPRSPMSPAVVLLMVFGGLAFVFMVGLFAAMAFYGVRKYQANAKNSKVLASATALARGMCDCARSKNESALPPSSRPVPSEMPKGGEVAVEPSQFEAAGFCSGLTGAQYAQFRWVQQSESTGYVAAVGDLDGDGELAEDDASFEVPVRLAGADCSVAEAIRVLPDGSTKPASTSPASDPRAGAEPPSSFTTSDGVWTLPNPGNYLPQTASSPDSSLFIGSAREELYLVIITESTQDMVVPWTLADYSKVVEGNLKKNSSEGAWQGPPRAIQVDGNPGMMRRFDATTDNLRLSYLVTVVESKGKLHQIMQWTLRSRYEKSEAGFILNLQRLKLAAAPGTP